MEFEIETLDLEFQGSPTTIAAFLVRGPGGPVLVETGPGSTTPTLVRGLGRLDVRPGDIKDVLLTHIHLDHAGAAGWWAQQGARVHVHHVGAPHLIDPERLLKSARRIYGDQLEALWAEVLAAPADRVRALHDGDVVEAGGLRFEALDTPGHARHHIVYRLGDAAFVGDLAGVKRPGLDHVRLQAPPPEFDLEAWLDSIRRVRALGLRRIYLTHFGPVDDGEALWEDVARLLPAFAHEVRAGLEAGRSRDEVVAHMADWEEARLRADGIDLNQRQAYLTLGSVGMSVDGVLRYWKKRAAA